MDEIKKIGYKPDLHYTDEYTADINFDIETETNDSTDNKTDIDDLLDLGDSLQGMLDSLPDFLGDIIKDPIDPIIDFVKDELKDKELDRVPVELDWTYEVPDIDWPSDKKEEDDDKAEDWDKEPDPWEEDDDIPIHVENNKKPDIIEKEYVKNLYDLFSDYYINLHGIISSFYSGFLYSIMNKETDEIKTIMDNIILNSSDVNKDRRHLLDFSIKTEIYRDMKLRYFSNNFDAEGSLRQTKNFKATYELRLRYAKIEKNNFPIARSDQMSNNILNAMSVSYDNKYDSSYEQLHRYLKSSNAILDDTLKTTLQLMRAKQTILETKGAR